MTNRIFFAKGDSPKMIKAFTDAQNTFKYLWRELRWEYRRIVHREAIAGNLTSVEVLLSLGADKTTKTNTGKTALDFARLLEWEHIIPLLEK
jgi:uncharacterized protein YegJ (DUF2314 family)